MKHHVDLHTPRDDEPLEQAVARARANYKAGTGVEHRVVSLWLNTWGEPGREPFGEWLAAWNG